MSSLISSYFRNENEAEHGTATGFCEVNNLQFGAAITYSSGCFSAVTVTLVSAHFWPEALYVVPVITAIAGCVFYLSVDTAVNSENMDLKAIGAFFGIVSSIPTSPFLIGAAPAAGAILAVSAIIDHRKAAQKQRQEELQNGYGYQEI